MMRRIVVMCLGLASCAWVSNSEFEEMWDVDGDGWGADDDCDEDNPMIYPFAPDVRGDGCDSDCGMEPDADGDDWPDDADCAPDDPTSFPCADENTNDDIDHDCDGDPSTRRKTACRPDSASGISRDHGLDPDYEPSHFATSEIEQAAIDADDCGNLSTGLED